MGVPPLACGSSATRTPTQVLPGEYYIYIILLSQTRGQISIEAIKRMLPWDYKNTRGLLIGLNSYLGVITASVA